jgi:uncharacterized membrane protein
MYIGLALLSALLYGAGDFFGGLGARRIAPLLLGFLTHVVVIVPMFVVATFIAAPHLRPVDLAWGAAGAIAGGLGVVLLYRGLAIGPMSVVSPLTAVIAAAVPVLFGVLIGDGPSRVQTLGIVLALLAIVLMTRADSSADHGQSVLPSTVVVSVLAGLGFGFYFIALERTSSGSGLWPIAVGRVASGSMFAVLIACNHSARKTFASLRGKVIGFTLAAAFGDVAANTLYLLAVRRGNLAVAAVLSSLYPASTVLLAGRFLHERLNRPQRIGLAIAAVAIGLVAGG